MNAQIFRIYSRAVISDDKNRILMIQKKPNQKIAGGLWILPGGTVEFGETPETGLTRELTEEICFSPTELHLIGVDTRIIGNTHWLGIFFKAKGDNKSIKNNEPDKHQAIQWCDIDFIKEHLSVNELSFLMPSPPPPKLYKLPYLSVLTSTRALKKISFSMILSSPCGPYEFLRNS